MPKYRIHEWHYTRNKSYPPGSIVEYPDTVEPHPQWERIDDESESEEKAKGRGGRRGRTTTSEDAAAAGGGSETHSKDEGNALRASDVGV